MHKLTKEQLEIEVKELETGIEADKVHMEDLMEEINSDQLDLVGLNTDIKENKIHVQETGRKIEKKQLELGHTKHIIAEKMVEEKIDLEIRKEFLVNAIERNDSWLKDLKETEDILKEQIEDYKIQLKKLEGKNER